MSVIGHTAGPCPPRCAGGRIPLSECKTDILQIVNDPNLDGIIIYETDNLLPGGKFDPEGYGGKPIPFLKQLFQGDMPSVK